MSRKQVSCVGIPREAHNGFHLAPLRPQHLDTDRLLTLYTYKRKSLRLAHAILVLAKMYILLQLQTDLYKRPACTQWYTPLHLWWRPAYSRTTYYIWADRNHPHWNTTQYGGRGIMKGITCVQILTKHKHVLSTSRIEKQAGSWISHGITSTMSISPTLYIWEWHWIENWVTKSTYTNWSAKHPLGTLSLETWPISKRSVPLHNRISETNMCWECISHCWYCTT